MITYAYERVSSKDQNLERQETAIRNYRPNISDANIFKDKVTGKTFDREHYHGFFLSTLLKHKYFYIKIQFSKFNINNCQIRKTAIPIKNIFVKNTGKFLKKVRCAEKKKS